MLFAARAWEIGKEVRTYLGQKGQGASLHEYKVGNGF